MTMSKLCFFFFKAEDGIRDWSVTGVQTCALPISFVLGNKKSTILYRQQLASWDTKKAIRTCLCMTGFAIDGMGVSMDDGLVGEGGRARRSSVSERELVGETNE